MLVEKEIIAPGMYWYTDEKTGVPRHLKVTPDMTRWWHEQGSKMLSAGLTVPVPFEHDFDAHPMTPADKLKNNAGWVKEYRLKDFEDPKRGKVKNALFGVVDVQDEEVVKKLPRTIRWTSPWINSFTDGNGNKWNNVITHLALTTRPRITDQMPFPSVAAALSMATEVSLDPDTPLASEKGLCLSAATRLEQSGNTLRPAYPMAFSLMSGAALASDDFPPKKKKGGDSDGKGGGGDGGDRSPPKKDSGDKGGDSKKSGGDDKGGGSPGDDDEDGGENVEVPEGMDKFTSKGNDISMAEVLSDLLGALGIHVENNGNEAMFMRALYIAAMSEIHNRTAQGGAGSGAPQKPGMGNQPPGGKNNSLPPNPLIQQEQQPMYMSLEDINKISDPTMRAIALSMYNENVKLRAEMEASKKTTDSLRDAKLKEAAAARATRVAMLSRLSPRVKADLEAMQANESYALSMGEGGNVIDPMATTLAVLEKGLADIPRLLTTPSVALSEQAQPTDGEMAQEAIDNLADDMARMMGCPPEARQAG